MPNQFAKIVAWQPRAEDWRVWQIVRNSGAKHEPMYERGTKTSTVESARGGIGANELGLLVRKKDGRPDFFVSNVSAIVDNIQVTGNLFGREVLAVIPSNPDGWQAWTTGPASRHSFAPVRSPIASRRDTKADAKRDARREMRQADTVCGVLIYNGRKEPSSFDPSLSVWNRIFTKWLSRDPAAELLR